jgi:hypothetical protein
MPVYLSKKERTDAMKTSELVPPPKTFKEKFANFWYYHKNKCYIGINAHYKSISRGVIDSRDLLYFIIVTAIFLLCTEKILRKRQ